MTALNTAVLFRYLEHRAAFVGFKDYHANFMARLTIGMLLVPVLYPNTAHLLSHRERKNTHLMAKLMIDAAVSSGWSS